MSQFLQFAASLREQMNGTLSRSDVLKALVWPMGILVSSTVALVAWKAPVWVIVVMVVLLMLFVLLYGGAYVFCLINDRDALRSERYTLHKMAIEHGVYGDSRIGFLNNDPQKGGSSSLISGPISVVDAEQ
jgi:hypothetical protein